MCLSINSLNVRLDMGASLQMPDPSFVGTSTCIASLSCRHPNIALKCHRYLYQQPNRTYDELAFRPYVRFPAAFALALSLEYRHHPCTINVHGLNPVSLCLPSRWWMAFRPLAQWLRRFHRHHTRPILPFRYQI